MKVEEYLKNNNDKKKNNPIFNLLKRTLITAFIVIIVLILCKSNNNIKTFIKKHVYETNYKFSKINNFYNKYILNFNKKKENILSVGTEKTLIYTNEEKYKDGVILTVDENYNVKVLESGLVVYVGDKDGIENVVIVQQSNGIDIVYGYVETDAKIYDYIEKDDVLGTANNKLYLSFMKDGSIVDYSPYIK